MRCLSRVRNFSFKFYSISIREDIMLNSRILAAALLAVLATATNPTTSTRRIAKVTADFARKRNRESTSVQIPEEPQSERAQHNAAIDAKKAAKRARQLARRASTNGE